MAKKTAKKFTKNAIKRIYWTIMAVVIVVFLIISFILNSTLSVISKDPSVNTLVNDAVFNMVKLTNLNKNLNEDKAGECWNQKNPHIQCSETNRIEEGSYTLVGGRDLKWLEGPFTKDIQAGEFKLSDEYINETLYGLNLENVNYNLKIDITYPEENLMHVVIKVKNTYGDEDTQELDIPANLTQNVNTDE